MFKIEKCILNYACFKHPWVLEVMSMSVDINEKIVLWLWSPGIFFFNSEQLYLRTPFFRSTSSECLQGLLERWLPLRILKVQSCKSHNNKYMIASTQITNTEIFVFIAALVFELLNRKVLFINRKDNRNC